MGIIKRRNNIVEILRHTASKRQNTLPGPRLMTMFSYREIVIALKKNQLLLNMN
jgi:hypothetical protein